VLNDVAKSVIEAQRGKHKAHVYTYRGKPVTGIYNSGWKVAREKAAELYAKDQDEQVNWGFANLRVHDLKHTFGRRLRAAGVSQETRKVLLGHRNGDITSHYSAPEIEELLEAANRVCAVQSRKSHALTLLKRKTA
jgi:integrase